MTTIRTSGKTRDSRAAHAKPAAVLALTALLGLGLGACSSHGAADDAGRSRDTAATATDDPATASATTEPTSEDTTTDETTTEDSTTGDTATDTATTDDDSGDTSDGTDSTDTTGGNDSGNSTGDSGGTSTGQDTSGDGLGDYQGTAKVTVTSYDYCGGQFGGERRRVGTQTYTTRGELILDHPTDDGSETESNPFDLSLFLGSAGGNGSFMLKSAQVFQAGSTLMLQYWSLDGDPSSFSGELSQSHRAEAAVVNQFWAANLLVACRPSLGTMPPSPAAVQEGARLSGQADGSSADLSFQGATTDGMYEFSVEFSS